MLIFSSNGRTQGKTDLDLYYSCLSGSGFSVPQSLAQFNSPSDDLGLVIHPFEKVGYYSSGKEGGLGNDDIYKIQFEIVIPELELLVRDKNTLTPLVNAKVKFSDNTNDVTNIQGIVIKKLKRNTDYSATAEFKDYVDGMASFTTKGIKEKVIRETINLEKIEVKRTYTLNIIYFTTLINGIYSRNQKWN